MRFDVLTLFPEIIDAYCNVSIMKRARENEIFSVNLVNPRDFTTDKHKKVDDTPYGGGAGMVLMPQPYVDAYESVEKQITYYDDIEEWAWQLLLGKEHKKLNNASGIQCMCTNRC